MVCPIHVPSHKLECEKQAKCPVRESPSSWCFKSKGYLGNSDFLQNGACGFPNTAGRLVRDLPQGSSGHSPVIVSESGPPVGGPQKRLYSTGQVYKQVTHQKEPAEPGGSWS